LSLRVRFPTPSTRASIGDVENTHEIVQSFVARAVVVDDGRRARGEVR